MKLSYYVVRSEIAQRYFYGRTDFTTLEIATLSRSLCANPDYAGGDEWGYYYTLGGGDSVQ
jgi:hypothetical protein